MLSAGLPRLFYFRRDRVGGGKTRQRSLRRTAAARSRPRRAPAAPAGARTSSPPCASRRPRAPPGPMRFRVSRLGGARRVCVRISPGFSRDCQFSARRPAPRRCAAPRALADCPPQGPARSRRRPAAPRRRAPLLAPPTDTPRARRSAPRPRATAGTRTRRAAAGGQPAGRCSAPRRPHGHRDAARRRRVVAATACRHGSWQRRGSPLPRPRRAPGAFSLGLVLLEFRGGNGLHRLGAEGRKPSGAVAAQDPRQSICIERRELRERMPL